MKLAILSVCSLFLFAADAPADDGKLEFKVVGGVIEIKGQDFVARAAEATYDPVKKTLTLVGAGTISVEVEKQGNTGQPQKLTSTKMIYDLDKKAFRLVDGSGGK